MIDYSDNKTNFLHELLLTSRKVANICKAFANYTCVITKV